MLPSRKNCKSCSGLQIPSQYQSKQSTEGGHYEKEALSAFYLWSLLGAHVNLLTSGLYVWQYWNSYFIHSGKYQEKKLFHIQNFLFSLYHNGGDPHIATKIRQWKNQTCAFRTLDMGPLLTGYKHCILFFAQIWIRKNFLIQIYFFKYYFLKLHYD